MTPALRKQRQENCPEFKASLDNQRSPYFTKDKVDLGMSQKIQYFPSMCKVVLNSPHHEPGEEHSISQGVPNTI